MRAWIAGLCVLLATAAAPASAQSDSYPSRPITIMVPFPPGGSSDTVTRIVAQKLADNLKTSVVIDNRGGGGGVPAAIAAKQTTPDGYTLFLANNGLFAIMPAMTPINFDRSRTSSRSRRCSRFRACWWCRRLHPPAT